MKNLSLETVATLILVTPLAGFALNARPLQPNEHQSNLPGITTIEAPPAGFNAITASDEELAYHGFPPRPNENTEPEAYANWVRAMNASKTRIVPQLEQTTTVHRPARPEQDANPTGVGNKVPLPDPHDNNLVTSNMSGYFVQSGATSYGSNSFYYIVSNFVVPVAQQAGCTGSWAYASEWSGIDGFGSSDVLQAGIDFDAYCSGGIRASYYAAWYEWYPLGEVLISGFPVAPGDDIFVEVWHTSPTQGYVYLVNNNTKQAVELGFTASPGHPLVGNSAEWIVEDPGVLINFGMIPFWHAVAYTESGIQFCSTSGTEIDEVILPTIIHPTPLGSCSFVDVY
jgi:hypothetical protein